MKTVQIPLDAGLLTLVDQAAKRLGTTRSAFARDALRAALTEMRVRELERKHREGYARKPVPKQEFSVAEPDRGWGD